jgi:hypothetical protein
VTRLTRLTRWRRPARLGGRLLGVALAALGWLVLAEPALADHCQDPSDCFQVQRSALAAAIGVTSLTAFSLVLDFLPFIGTAKGFIQLLTGRDLVTGERLSTFERLTGWIPFAAGKAAGAAATLGALRGAGVLGDAGRLGRGGSGLGGLRRAPGGAGTSGTPGGAGHGGPPTSGGTPGAPGQSGYPGGDPRSDAQLQRDTDPTPRSGETQAQATQRAEDAAYQLQAREFIRRYEALPDRPPRIDMRENDARYGSLERHPAHTTGEQGRHDPNMPLRRSDAEPIPTGRYRQLPDGRFVPEPSDQYPRTVEGRVTGDAPWEGRRQNFSTRWKSDADMNREVNKYMNDNWERIRLDLADGEKGYAHEGFGWARNEDGSRTMIGEGFANKNQGFTNPPGVPNVPPGRPEPEYFETDSYRITIRVDPNDPSKPFVVRAIPEGAPRPPDQPPGYMGSSSSGQP